MTDAHHEGAHGATPPSSVSHILAIVGALILLVIVLWGFVHLLSLSGDFLSSLFGGKAKSAITITAPEAMVSGKTEHISWAYRTKATGSYALLYPCSKGLSFAVQTADNFTPIPCGTAFTVGQATTSASIMPMLAGTSSIRTPISVLFIPSSTSTKPAEGSKTVTVAQKTDEPTAPEETSGPDAAETATRPTTPSGSGTADLAVNITSVWADIYGNGTVSFDVSNVGTGSSGAYTFTVELPTFERYVYSSSLQAPLSPGSFIANNLSFTQGIPGMVSVTVTPAHGTPDANQDNNSAYEYLGGQRPTTYYPYYQY